MMASSIPEFEPDFNPEDDFDVCEFELERAKEHALPCYDESDWY